ncbi:MAG: TonB-dependent receptor [Sphingomonadales bacterium]
MAGSAMANTGTNTGLEEIIVTAQKRAQNIMDVPVSVSAFTESHLQAIGARSLEDIAFRTPNFGYMKSSDLKLRPATIRGVFGGTTGGVDPAVGMYIDEVYLGTAAATQFDLFDLERVEILRGPQGTLFGRNTTGGAVSFTTRKPDDEFRAMAMATVGNYDLVRIQGMVSGPIVEGRLAGKVSAVYHDRGGLHDNTFLGEKTNAEENWSVRGHLRFTPTERMTFDLAMDYREARRQPTRQIVTDNFLFQSGIPGLDFTSDGDPFSFRISQEGHNIERLDAWGASLNGVYEFDGFDLTSITAYREHEYFQEIDTDTTPIRWTYDGDPEDQWQFSQELRLTSTGDRTFDWIAGAFYFHQNSDNLSFVRLGEDILAFLGLPTSPDLFARANGLVKTDSYAGYAQGVYHFTDKLDLTVGGRLSHDRKSISYEQTDESGGVVGAVAPYERADSWTELTGDVTLSYRPGDQSMVYVKAARGYKAGGFNDGLGSEDNPSFGPEFVWSFEGGVKATFADNRISTSLAVFHMLWDDIQISGFDTVDRDGELVFGVFTGNFGKAKSSGVEMDIQMRPFDGLELTGAAGYLDGKFTEGDPVNPADPNAQPNIAKGNRLPLSPRWSLSGSAEYTQPVSIGDLIWRIEYVYTGRQDLTAFGANGNDPLGRQGGFGLLNGRISLDMGRYQLSVWGRNLTDEKYATRFQNLSFPPIFSSFYALGEPRTFGADLRVDF